MSDPSPNPNPATHTWELDEDDDRAPCPMGCGNLTDDVAGGPCSACWASMSRMAFRSSSARAVTSGEDDPAAGRASGNSSGKQ